MAIGVTPDGFVIERLPEIRSRIIARLQDKTGVTFETDPDSFTGRFIDAFAEIIAELHEEAQGVYAAMYPGSAEGANLDNAVSFSGVRRLMAKRTVAYGTITGVQGTVVNAGFAVRTTDTRKTFQLYAPIMIDREKANQITIAVSDATDSATYSVTINGNVFSHVAPADTSGNNIAIELHSKITAADIDATRNANEITISSREVFDPMNVTTTTNINSLDRIGVIGTFLCTEVGEVIVPTGVLTQIVNAQSGVESVTNRVEGIPGRKAEKDDELRASYRLGVFRLGAGNPTAIRANILQNVPNVSYCEVYENKLLTTDTDGRPAKSMEAVISGGDPTEIAEELHRVWAGGIDYFGSVSVTVKDASGHDQVVKFNRPAPVYVWLNVEIERYSEEDFPGNGIQLTKEAIVRVGNAFGVGTDVIPQRFFGEIFRSVDGVKSISITMATSTTPFDEPASGSFTDATRPISVRQFAQFNQSRIAVQVL